MNHFLNKLVFFLLFPLCISGQVGTGQWVDHLSYTNVHQIVETPGVLYAASGAGFFSIDLNSGELTRYSKVNGLSDIGVSRLGYDENTGTLIIGYSNGNIDLKKGGAITNLPDILNSTLIGDKTINSILIENGKAWLSCGFGIVLIDIALAEVSDSYFISPVGGNLRVNDILLEPEYVLAATEIGILTANRTDNLSDFSNWQPLDGFPGNGSEVSQLIRFQDSYLAHVASIPDKMYRAQSSVWSEVAGTSGALNQDIIVRDDKVLFVNTYYAQLRNIDLNEISVYAAPSFTNNYNYHTGYIGATGSVYLGETHHGVIAFNEVEDLEIHPDGPYNESSWQIRAGNGQLWVTHGAIAPNGDNIYNNDASSVLMDGQWISFKDHPVLASVRDHVEAVTDPFNPNVAYIGLWLGGLLKVKLEPQELTVYNETLDNSPISENLLNPERYQVGGLDFDPSGNLWINNSGSAEPLKVWLRNGQWQSYSLSPTLSAGSYIGELVHTDEGMVWMILPRGNGIIVYDYRGTLSTSNDDRIKKLGTGENEGSLPTSDVLCIAKDLDGEIWAGTSAGPAIHFSPAGIFNSDPIDFQQILIEQDGVVEVLLGNQTITSIAVDGANRKWLGTLNDGVFLLSADGTQQIKRFTKQNSPLFSNTIKDITIDPSDGTVYFATSEGILGFVSDANAGTIESTCYDVYPNPVRPEYSGPITIDGLSRDSNVKITDLAGNLVFQMISKGGRAVWDGNDFNGRRVATGVYYALVSSPEAESTCTSKILMVN